MTDKKIILSADSTCDLNKELKEQYQVNYFPYYINFRDKIYRDNVDIFPQDLFKGYAEDKSLPKTAASNSAEWKEYFKQWTDQGFEVIHFSLGHALSSSYDNSSMAADELEGVYVIDSCNLSTGTGQLVIRAGRMIEQGMSAKEIVAEVEKLKPCVHSSFVMDTMDFMAAGGRCPAIAAKAAGMLKCKPYLSVDNTDGSLNKGKIYRGKIESVLKKYIEEELGSYNDIVADDIFITNSSGFDDSYIDELEEVIKGIVPFERVHRSTASCTISSHCGPKTLGILFISKCN